jgi:hypothetical protein
MAVLWKNPTIDRKWIKALLSPTLRIKAFLKFFYLTTFSFYFVVSIPCKGVGYFPSKQAAQNLLEVVFMAENKPSKDKYDKESASINFRISSID